MQYCLPRQRVILQTFRSQAIYKVRQRVKQPLRARHAQLAGNVLARNEVLMKQLLSFLFIHPLDLIHASRVSVPPHPKVQDPQISLFSRSTRHLLPSLIHCQLLRVPSNLVNFKKTFIQFFPIFERLERKTRPPENSSQELWTLVKSSRLNNRIGAWPRYGIKQCLIWHLYSARPQWPGGTNSF